MSIRASLSVICFASFSLRKQNSPFMEQYANVSIYEFLLRRCRIDSGQILLHRIFLKYANTNISEI